ncbi:hypothetical protein RB595_003907 [Gaeumannomyces hyphopodioides]
MRRLELLLVAAGLRLCSARHHAFSIHEDMLAHPQFDVVFSNSFIWEDEALAVLQGKTKLTSATISSESAPTDARSSVKKTAQKAQDDTKRKQDAGSDDDDDSTVVLSEKYELINHPPFRFLCATPVLAPTAAPNHTATELAKAEEAREVERAAARGWELMGGLEGRCLFYQSGWWSYTFCYNGDVVQFHALPPQSGGSPVRDPSAPEYVLGRSLPQSADSSGGNAKNGGAGGRRGGFDIDTAGREEQAVLQQNSGSSKHTPAGTTEMVVKGDQRYLVQRLDSGTVCDLTNRPRTIEIQYHCAPGTTVDRINWIKEVTTCTYLMMVQTPRLCEDGAFRPPKPVRSHPITCRRVVTSAEEARGLLVEGWGGGLPETAGDALGPPVGTRQTPQSGDKPRHLRDFKGVNIGGQVIGSRSMLGRSEDGQGAVRLNPPPRRRTGARAAGAEPNAPQVQVLAVGQSKAEGGRVEVVLDHDLESLGLDPAVVEALRHELEDLAADHGWKLEMVDQPGRGVEIRAIVLDPEHPQFFSYDGYSYEDDKAWQADDAQGGRRSGVKRDKSGNAAAAAGKRAQDYLDGQAKQDKQGVGKMGEKQGKEKQEKGKQEKEKEHAGEAEAGSEEQFFRKDEL